MIRPNTSYAAWKVDNVSASNLVIRDGILSSFDLQFGVPDYLGETTSWVGIQTKIFEDRDLKDNGNVYNNKEYWDRRSKHIIN